MPSKVMLAPDPKRPGKIDRVVVLSTSSDGQRAIVLSIDRLGTSDQVRQRFARYYLPATNWKAAAIACVIAGAVTAFVWQWWLLLIGLALGVAAGRASQSSVATSALRMVQEHPESLSHFAQAGLAWETPIKSVVPQ